MGDHVLLSDPVELESEVVVRLEDGTSFLARVELVGGRERHSVGGEIAEGPRRWYGSVRWLGAAPSVRPGNHIEVELGERRGVAEIEVVSTALGATLVGLGPPPFPVD